MRRALSLLTSLLALLAILAGCKIQEAQPPLKKRPREYRTVVSLSPGTTEILLGALFIERLSGRTAADNFPEMTVKSVPVVLTNKIDYERLQQIRPDLVVYDATLMNAADLQKLKEMGATTFGLSANTLDEFRVQLFELANLVGNATKASEYADRIALERNAAKASAPTPAPRVAIVMPGRNGDHWIAGKNSFQADVVREAGGDIVGPDTDQFVRMNPEQLVQLNPQILIVTGSKDDTAGALALARDPRLQTVEAVRKGNIRAINADVLLRKGGRVDKLVKAVSTIVNSGS